MRVRMLEGDYCCSMKVGGVYIPPEGTESVISKNDIERTTQLSEQFCDHKGDGLVVDMIFIHLKNGIKLTI